MVQPVPKNMTKEQKEEKVEEFKEKIERYPVIGILDMQNLPSRQLQQMKKEMKEFADIKMSRKTLMQIAIEKAEKKDIEQLEENDAVQPAFIFSDKDPFQLYSLIKRTRHLQQHREEKYHLQTLKCLKEIPESVLDRCLENFNRQEHRSK